MTPVDLCTPDASTSGGGAMESIFLPRCVVVVAAAVWNGCDGGRVACSLVCVGCGGAGASPSKKSTSSSDVVVVVIVDVVAFAVGLGVDVAGFFV